MQWTLQDKHFGTACSDFGFRVLHAGDRLPSKQQQQSVYLSPPYLPSFPSLLPAAIISQPQSPASRTHQKELRGRLRLTFSRMAVRSSRRSARLVYKFSRFSAYFYVKYSIYLMNSFITCFWARRFASSSGLWSVAMPRRRYLGSLGFLRVFTVFANMATEGEGDEWMLKNKPQYSKTICLSYTAYPSQISFSYRPGPTFSDKLLCTNMSLTADCFVHVAQAVDCLLCIHCHQSHLHWESKWMVPG